jgi:threonine dehydrogenase-like Zn-dependent dehydrogenase
VIDINQRRLDFALANGATHVILDEGDEIVVKAKLYEICGGRGADVVVEAVGLPPAWYAMSDERGRGRGFLSFLFPFLLFFLFILSVLF